MTELAKAWEEGRQKLRDTQQLEGGSFAEACFNTSRPSELIVDAERVADTEDCIAWKLTPEQWAFELGIAYEALIEADKRIETWKSN